MTKLYVGNLSEEVTEKSLTELFDSFGDVNEVAVFKDKGFGFVVRLTLVALSMSPKLLYHVPFSTFLYFCALSLL